MVPVLKTLERSLYHTKIKQFKRSNQSRVFKVIPIARLLNYTDTKFHWQKKRGCHHKTALRDHGLNTPDLVFGAGASGGCHQPPWRDNKFQQMDVADCWLNKEKNTKHPEAKEEKRKQNALEAKTKKWKTPWRLGETSTYLTLPSPEVPGQGRRWFAPCTSGVCCIGGGLGSCLRVR